MKQHVLLIDGDAKQQLFFTAVLGGIGDGITCSTACNVKDAIGQARKERPGFVFTEYKLEGADGLQLLSYMKNKRKLQHAKIYLYTAVISDELGKMARLLGAAGCIQKSGNAAWIAHQLKAILAADLLPSYVILEDYQSQLLPAPNLGNGIDDRGGIDINLPIADQGKFTDQPEIRVPTYEPSSGQQFYR